MIPAWLEQAAAFLILWFALAITLGPFIGRWLRTSARHLPPACICGPLQSDPEQIDERPDCPAHDFTAWDDGEVPF